VKAVRVIGCGNPDAGDDALGLMAVRGARPGLPPGVDVAEARTAVHIIDLLEGARSVILVDAVRSGGVPGAFVRIDGAQNMPSQLRSSLSSHGIGVAEALAVAAAVGPLPRLVFFGLEAETAQAGAALSAQVSSALPGLIAAIGEEVRRLEGEDP
jgi:hydrogenase maturation protease